MGREDAAEEEGQVVEFATVQSFERGTDDYESARMASVRNGGVPDRFPDLIVRPEYDEEVVAAVRHAIAHDMTIGVRYGASTGNSAFLQDGGMLIDLQRMAKISLDVDTGVAYVEPAAQGGELNGMLAAYGLMFPSSHRLSAGIGDFILGGAPGWNSRRWGFGAQNVLGIDVVTAAGELIHAGPADHADLFWAARGGGSDFFGVITRFHLATHPLPIGMMTSTYVYPLEVFDELVGWLDAAHGGFPTGLEVSITVVRERDTDGRLVIELSADALFDSTAAAHEALSLLEECPVRDALLSSNLMNAMTLDGLTQRFEELLDVTAARYDVRTHWTNAPTCALLPALHAMIDGLSDRPSHLHLLWCGDEGAGTALLQGRLFLTEVATPDQPRSGELDERPFMSMSHVHLTRLGLIRQAYDSSGRFHAVRAADEAGEKQ